MKTIHILGTAPGIENYKPDGSETIGVNDIFKYHATDNLLTIDKPVSFTTDRLNTIIASQPKHFYSSVQQWRVFFPEMNKINLTPEPGDRNGINIESSLYVWHVDSTFTAVHLAYKKGAKKIVMYGVNFSGQRWNDYKFGIVRCYNELATQLRNKGVMLYIANPESLLAQVLPIINH